MSKFFKKSIITLFSLSFITINACSANRFKDFFESPDGDLLNSNEEDTKNYPLSSSEISIPISDGTNVSVDEEAQGNEQEPFVEQEDDKEVEVEKYYATFIINGEEIVLNLAEGEEIEYPEVTNIPHYHFVSWDQDISIMPNHDITITAIYEINNHTLTFNLGYGDIITQQLDYGETITYPSDPTNDDNHFIGWDLDITTMPDEDVVINALWKEKIKGVLNYVDSNNNESSLTWEELIDRGVVKVGVTNGKVAINDLDTSILELTDGVLIIDDSVEYIFNTSGELCPGVKKIILPDTLNKLNSNALEKFENLEEVVLGSSLTEIPSDCFYECHSLRTINMEHITRIGFCAFKNCISLEEVNLLPILEYIGTNAYVGCTSIGRVTIGTTCLDGSSSTGIFEDCLNLTTVNKTADIKQIVPRMFLNCNQLNIDFLEGIEIIGDDSFRVYTSTYEPNPYPVVLPSTIKSLSGQAFGSSYTSDYKYPVYINRDINFVYDTEPRAPSNAPFFTASSVNVLDENGDISFQGRNYSPITKIYVPRNVTKIYKYLFANMTSVTDIYIPREVEAIGGKIFYNLPNGSINVHYEGTQEEWAALPKTEKDGRSTINNLSFNTTNIEYNTVLDY